MAVKSSICFRKNGEPLSVYSSRSEADSEAAIIRFAYGNEMSSYNCHKCGKWHLSPVNRQTPSKKCIYCTDHNGNEKDLYETENAAMTRAQIIKNERGIDLRVYECPHQNGWHLTKNISEY